MLSGFIKNLCHQTLQKWLPVVDVLELVEIALPIITRVSLQKEYSSEGMDMKVQNCFIKGSCNFLSAHGF